MEPLVQGVTERTIEIAVENEGPEVCHACVCDFPSMGSHPNGPFLTLSSIDQLWV